MPDRTRSRLRRLSVAVALIVSVVLGVLAHPILAAGQATQKVFRVGHLAAGARTPDGAPPAVLREALRGLGYIEGQNVNFEARFAEGKIDRLSSLAADLVRLKVDVIVPTEAVPKASRIAVLWNANDQGMTLRYREIEKAARILRVEVQAFAVRQPDDFAVAFSAMTRRRPDAMFLVADSLTSMNRQRFIEFAATHRVPAMYEFGSIVRDGGLMLYGPSQDEGFRRAAFYIDRILKGAKPADLPAEQPTRYYLTVNLATAATLGLTIPNSLLLRADDVVH